MVSPKCMIESRSRELIGTTKDRDLGALPCSCTRGITSVRSSAQICGKRVNCIGPDLCTTSFSLLLLSEDTITLVHQLATIMWVGVQAAPLQLCFLEMIESSFHSAVLRTGLRRPARYVMLAQGSATCAVAGMHWCCTLHNLLSSHLFLHSLILHLWRTLTSYMHPGIPRPASMGPFNKASSGV